MSGTGSNPAWVDGYIPPASEWNAWFGFKLDAASPLVEFAPFVSLTGTDKTGPVTGTFEVDGTIKTTSDLIVNGGIYINPTGLTTWTFSEQTTTGDHIQFHSTGHFEQWTVTSAHRYWYANNTQVMDLDAVGNLTALLSVKSAQLMLPNSWRFYNSAADGSGDDIQLHSTGNFDVWIRGTGERVWSTNAVNVMLLEASGALTVTGALGGASLVFTNGWTLFRNTTTGDYTNEYFVGTYDTLQESNHTRTWTTNGTGVMNLDAGGNLLCAGTVHGTNITTMTTTVDELRALVQDLQTRLETLEAAPRASHT